MDDLNEPPPNPARAVQSFVGEVMAVAFKPVDMAVDVEGGWTG